MATPYWPVRQWDHVIQLFTRKAAPISGCQRQQLADVGTALGIEYEASSPGIVAQYAGQEFTGIY
nr:hypothetical protein [Janthinobacterium sp. UMAB-56]